MPNQKNASNPGAPVQAFQAAYEIRDNRPVIMNAYGFPRAQPLFPTLEFTLNGIRGYPNLKLPCEYCNCYPGPNIPAHWWDAGHGWVTNYFTNIQAYDPDTKQPGVFQCNVPTPQGRMCGHQIHNEVSCASLPCFCPSSEAPEIMRKHLIEAHGFKDPGKREWSTGLCETQGCCDVIFCTPCHGSRQMMAALGHANTFNIYWCLLLCFLGCECQSSKDESGNNKNSVTWTPPCIETALLTRIQVATLNNIDENLCCVAVKSVCCSCCSIAQTYRELSAAGVWPGGICNGTAPETQMKPATIMK